MSTVQKRLNLIDKAIHEINLSSQMDRWLADQDSHWHNGPLDEAYVAAKEVLVARREEIRKLLADKSQA